MNKKAQNSWEDISKAVITLIIGIVLISSMIPLASPELIQTFINIGIFLIIAGGVAIAVAIWNQFR